MNSETEYCYVDSSSIHSSEHAIGHGAMLLCAKGCATVKINFDDWLLGPDSFIIFYPGDFVKWSEISNDFSAKIIRYSADVLRAASMNIEHEIYRELRDDRICSNKELIRVVVNSMFKIFDFYYNDPYTKSIDRIATLQVKSFFIGFADYMRYNPDSPRTKTNDKQSIQRHFAAFMRLIESHYKEGYEVSYYAEKMNISRKYLGNISRQHTGHTAKEIIDDYRVQQLKLALTTTNMSIKEITTAFHFSDQAALSRYFKAHTGKTPKDYKML